MKRIYLVAGEESGDIHGANLIRALQAQSPDIECEGLGGQRMADAGMTLHYDLAGDAIMGFTEVVKKFAGIRRLFLDAVERIEQARPDALVLIDYPGFNIRLAKRISQLGIPIVFYISPQVWAWKKKRIHTLAKYVDKMLVIFPFEKNLYDAVDLDCAYVGHPLLDHIGNYKHK
ncbi:MAG: lipid-A-disaccharide synthase, partial [Candidatus Hydrogenedentes bacterium]|nr:lipid-A-disaccharide synthase [Candidatus Hydrogenedentota bacterium]